MQTLKPQMAVSDFKKILAIEPHNETVRQQMVSTQKLIRKIEFEKVRILLARLSLLSYCEHAMLIVILLHRLSRWRERRIR